MLFFVGKLWITNSVFLIVTDLFTFSVSFNSGLHSDCAFLGFSPFLLGCPVCWCVVHSSLSWFFGIVFICPLYVSSVSFLILFEYSFFLSLGKGLSIFLLFSKNQLLVVFFPICLLSILFTYALILIVSIFLLACGLVCSFSSSLKYKVSLFIWDLTSFLMWVFITMNFPQSIASVASHKF